MAPNTTQRSPVHKITISSDDGSVISTGCSEIRRTAAPVTENRRAVCDDDVFTGTCLGALERHGSLVYNAPNKIKIRPVVVKL